MIKLNEDEIRATKHMWVHKTTGEEFSFESSGYLSACSNCHTRTPTAVKDNDICSFCSSKTTIIAKRSR